MFAAARTKDLIVTEVGDEAIVYDTIKHRAILLNPTANRIWQNCDGKSSPEAIAVRLMNLEEAETQVDIVNLGLKHLARVGLLEVGAGDIVSASSMTRRALLNGLGSTAKLGLLLPVVTFLAAPSPARAASITKSTGGGGGGGIGGPGDGDKACQDRDPFSDGCGGDPCQPGITLCCHVPGTNSCDCITLTECFPK